MSENNKFYVSHSRLSSFRRCRQRYYWQYVKKHKTAPSMGQSRGTAGHAALASWHREQDTQKALDAAWNAWAFAGHQAGPDWQLLEDALARYFDFSAQRDTFKVLKSEQMFEIEYEVLGQPVVLTGFIDGVVSEAGANWLLENKFHKNAQTGGLEMDAQSSIYMLAAKYLGIEAQGVIYNIVRVGDTKIARTEPAIRKRLYRSSEGLGRLEEEVLVQVEEMLKFHADVKPYRNQTKDCGWDCSYYQPCLILNEDGLEPISLLENISKG